MDLLKTLKLIKTKLDYVNFFYLRTINRLNQLIDIYENH